MCIPFSFKNIDAAAGNLKSADSCLAQKSYRIDLKPVIVSRKEECLAERSMDIEKIVANLLESSQAEDDEIEDDEGNEEFTEIPVLMEKDTEQKNCPSKELLNEAHSDIDAEVQKPFPGFSAGVHVRVCNTIDAGDQLPVDIEDLSGFKSQVAYFPGAIIDIV
ncbi:unnamed protein product [Protopolystoma xenopodis]|uniref:Uncharacterized protein n=1 Tax=Protopolystoma xenopodis TaxID=117903 RepID=A0A448WSN4_9PLAT|nr:unnamed protein product [Protopolystoma xenopodis]